MFRVRLPLPVGFFVVIAIVNACTNPKPDHVADALVVQTDSDLNRAADSLYFLGERERKKGASDSALYFHEQALRVRERRKQQDERLAYSYWKTGRLLYQRVKLAAANRRFDRAMALADTFHLPVDTLVTVYLNAATTKGEMLDATSSVSLVAHAMLLVRSQQPLNRSRLAQCYRTLANVHHSTGNDEEALRNFWYAKAYAPATTSKRIFAEWNFNIALSHLALERYDSGMYYLNRSLQIRIPLFGPTSVYVRAIYLNKGDFFRKMGLYDSALYYQRKTLAICQATFGEKNLNTAGALESIGDTYHDNGQFDSAILYRQGQLRSLIEDFDSREIAANPSPREEEITMDLVAYLVDKATTLRSMAAVDKAGLELLEQSLRTYLLADSIYEVYQANLQLEDLALSQLNAAPVPYWLMMDVTAQLHRISGNKSLMETALQIMERSKAVALKNALSRARSFEELELPGHLAANEKTLLQRRSGLVQLLISEYGRGKRDSINEAIFNIDQEYNHLKAAIAREQPNYHLLNYGSDITLDRLNSIMRKANGLWVDYLWGDDKLFILSVSSSDARLYEVTMTPELVSRIRSTASTVYSASDSSYTRKSFKQFAGDSHALFKQLLEPALNGRNVSRLVISPAGPLMAFPFEVLTTSMPTSEEVDYRLDYVVNKYDVSYEYSGSFMEHQVSGDRHGDKLLAVGFAADDDSGDTRDDLPGAREELEAIKATMTNNNNRYLLDADASEAEFKSNAEQFNLLHLAVHGIGDTLNSMKSHLVFRDQATDQDGKLYAHELYTLDLRSVDMAVLSACESGVGRIQPGEGVMSIARGFRYAGCPSLIISLWKISDKKSAALMSKFYSRLSKGTRIDNALAMAKRDYLAEENMLNSHPFYWAAFLSVGDTSPVSLSVRTSTIYAIVLSAFVALSVAWFAWRRATSRRQPRVQQG